MINCDDQHTEKYPKVSLIIPNLNGKQLLNECLTSLLNLKYPDYEIIVSDGGSTDGTHEMIKNEFNNIIFLQENGAGIGRSNNLGIKHSRGDVICFDLNNDEIFDPDWLIKLIKVLLSSPKNGVVGGGRIVYGTDNIIDEGGYIFSILGLAKNNSGKNIHKISKEPKPVDFVGIPCFRKSLINKIGLCDENYHLYFEDSDFCLRTLKAGYNVLWVPDAISYHRRHASNKYHTKYLEYLIIRNRLRFILKNFRNIRLITSVLFLIFIFPLISLTYSLMYKKNTGLSRNKYYSLLYINNITSYIINHLKALLWNLYNLKTTMGLRFS